MRLKWLPECHCSHDAGQHDKKQSLPIVTALVLSRNGNAITLNRSFLRPRGVTSLADLESGFAAAPQIRSIALGWCILLPCIILMLRYWLASGGIDPDEDINLIRIPPPQMVANLKAGNIDGYCVGEPWNSRAISAELGLCDRYRS